MNPMTQYLQNAKTSAPPVDGSQLHTMKQKTPGLRA